MWQEIGLFEASTVHMEEVRGPLRPGRPKAGWFDESHEDTSNGGLSWRPLQTLPPQDVFGDALTAAYFLLFPLLSGRGSGTSIGCTFSRTPFASASGFSVGIWSALTLRAS